MSRNVVSRLLLSVALLLLVLPVVAGAEGPADAALSLQACPASPAVTPAEIQPAPEDLFLPEPTFVCKGGMCSDNEQCELWHGPGSTCEIGAGQSCGVCVS